MRASLRDALRLTVAGVALGASAPASGQESLPVELVAVWPAREPPTDGDVVIAATAGVDRAGRALSVRIDSPTSAAFDAAAAAAVRRWLAGARNRRPASIRFVVRFPRISPELETTVTASPPSPGRRSLGDEEVQRTPGTMGDPFRIIETLPGVTPIATGVPHYFVRGAPPADTAVFFDGIRVPALFHVALGPSVIHPSLVERVDFWPGGAPARFAGTVGGVVAATPAPIRADRPRLDVDARLIDVGGLASAPLHAGRTRATVSGRYSFAGPLLEVFSPGIEIGYWDYQARLDRDLGSRTTATLFAFGSHDHERTDQTSDDVLSELAQDFHRLVARVRSRRASSALQLDLTLGTEKLGLDRGFAVSERTVGPRIVFDTKPRRWLEIGLGAEAQWSHSNLDDARFEPGLGEAMGDPARQTLEETLTATDVLDAAMWAEARIRAGPDFAISPGLRLAALAAGDDVQAGADPGLTLRFDASPSVALEASVALHHQRPTYVLPLPGLDGGDIDRGLQRAVQVAQGIEWRPPGFLVQTQLFFHEYENLSDMDLAEDSTPAPRLDGSSYGLELVVRRALGRRLFGWLAYTLSRNVRRFPGGARAGRCPTDVIEEGSGSLRFFPTVIAPSEFDRTHVLSLVASYLLPADVRAGVRLSARSGRPFTRMVCELGGQVVYEERNGERSPWYAQLDLRIDKRWRFEAWQLETYLEVINATFSADVLGMRQDLLRDGSKGEPRPDLQVPIVIPTLGARGTF